MRGRIPVGFALLLVLFFLFSGIAEATLVGKIVMTGVPDRFKSANKNEITTGLKTVGLGTRVVLAPQVVSGTGSSYADTSVAITSANWTLTVPVGSSATIQDTATGLSGLFVYFIPDIVGNYTISMTAVTAKGTSSSVSITVVASKFVGEGISLSATNVIIGCACHRASPTVFQTWQQTNHATAVMRAVNTAGGHFSFNCMNCHSPGFDTIKTINNNGFTDMAKLELFTKIPTNGPNVSDTLIAHYPKSMALAGIQCENCHGPADQHANDPTFYPSTDATRLDHTLSADVCNQCHASTDRHGIGYAWTASKHATSLAEGSQLEYTNRPVCSRCHTGQGFITEYIGGSPEPSPQGTGTNPKMFNNASAVTCATCHDPHDGSNPMQLRVKALADACVGCHITRISSHGGLHSAHQGPMLIGANGTPFTLQNMKNYLANSGLLTNAVGNWGGWELPGYTYENSSHSNIQDRCVVCHMASSPSYLAASASNFTKPDTMLTKLGGHTFEVSYTDPISGKVTLNPTGCSASTCHDGTIGIGFVDATQSKTQAFLDQLYALLPLRDTTKSSTAPRGNPVYATDTVVFQNLKGAVKRPLMTIEKAAAYNYTFVTNDLSGGVHNFLYAKGLLESSIEQLKLAAAAANINSVTDVPSDNGKAVQLVWNQFPAEKYAFGSIDHYYVFRLDPNLGSSQTSSTAKVNSIGAMLSLKPITGTKVTAGGTTWTCVGIQPISNLSQYSMIVPTLFDSTKTMGMHYTSFMIAGMSSSDPSIKYVSPIDSGYSLNNLIPSTPSGTSAASTSQGVVVSWNPPPSTDNDIDHYEIYRGTAPTFTPSTLLGTSKTTSYLDAGAMHGPLYYKVAAVDNGGNRSAFGLVILTGVTEASGIPTEYKLGQNYPNPFNPTTNINFSIPKETHVNMRVYSITGEEIATLIDRNVSAGNYTVTWNGKDGVGNTVSNGIYLCRIIAGDFTAVKKMMMLK